MSTSRAEQDWTWERCAKRQPGPGPGLGTVDSSITFIGLPYDIDMLTDAY